MSHIHIELELKEASPGPVEGSAKGRSYARLMFALSPTWLQMSGARELMTTLGTQKDLGVADAVAATRARFAALAPDDALDLIGATFDLERLPNENDDAYRARLLTAFAQWEKAGTEAGLVAGVEGLGYTLIIYPVKEIEPSRWAEFGLIVLHGEREVEEDGDTRRQVERVAQKLKAAHTRLAATNVNASGRYWGDGTRYGEDVWRDDLQGTWGDGTVWGGSRWQDNRQLYLDNTLETQNA